MPALLAQKEGPAVGRKACEELIRRELFAGIRREELPRVAPLPRLQVGGRVAVRFEAVHELAPRRNLKAFLREKRGGRAGRDKARRNGQRRATGAG